MNKPNSASFFDHFAKRESTKIGNYLVKTTAKQIFEFTKTNENSKLLEIGAGHGIFANICLQNKVEYTAIEPNETMALNLEKKGVKVLRVLVPPVSQFSEQFDAIVMINVMEHMNSMKDALEVAQSAYKLLKPRGRFVIYVPDYISWKHHFFLSDFSHNYITTWCRMEGLLISAGFEKIEGKYQSGPFKGFFCLLSSSVARWLPFGFLSSTFPRSKLLKKLYKIQTPFLRRVLIAGQKT